MIAGEFSPTCILQLPVESSLAVFVAKIKGGAGDDIATGYKGD